MHCVGTVCWDFFVRWILLCMVMDDRMTDVDSCIKNPAPILEKRPAVVKYL
jgi:hypothetical protein